LAKRAKAVKKYLSIGLINSRSLNKKEEIIQQHLLSTNLDVLAVTETWLTAEHGDATLENVCPAGYDAVHLPRDGRGGGVALIYRSSIRVKSSLVTLSPPPTSFELISRSLFLNSVCIRMWVIYRSPSQSVQRFLDEFSDLLELVSVSSGKLLIVGDFNIHVDDPSCSVARKFLSLLDTFGLTQHVKFPTRLQSGRPGHSVDLVLSRSTDNFVVDCYNSDLISDHFSIHTLARVFHPIRPQKTVSYRKIKSIDPVCFSSDLAASPLISDPSDDLTTLLLQYNSLADILDKHAPLITRKVTVRADNPWDCAEIHSIRRNCRKLERIYRKRKLVVDGDIFVSCRDRLHRLITEKKQSYLSNKIAEATGKHSLYKIVDFLSRGLHFVCRTTTLSRNWFASSTSFLSRKPLTSELDWMLRISPVRFKRKQDLFHNFPAFLKSPRRKLLS